MHRTKVIETEQESRVIHMPGGNNGQSPFLKWQVVTEIEVPPVDAHRNRLILLIKLFQLLSQGFKIHPRCNMMCRVGREKD